MPAVKDLPVQSRVPGEPGIWVLVSGDLLVFSLFFAVFAHDRHEETELFRSSRALLSQPLGALNTLLMLSSSWFVALAVRAARLDHARTPRRCFAAAFICGLGFCIVKGFEYSAKLGAGLTVVSNDFFMYYFVLTGIHLLHVVLGMGVLLFLAHQSRGTATAGRMRNLESGAIFWHLVDLLWIVLFALLYLLP